MRGQMTHLDPDVLADYDAGLITGRRGAQIAAHLADCDRCRAVSEELAGMSVLLAAVPAPVMPDLLAQRLETALAAEVAHRDIPERAGATPHAAPQPPRRQARSPRFRLVALRVLAPAAAVLLLAAGGYRLSQLGGPAGHTTAASGASQPKPSSVSNPALAPAAGSAASAASGASAHSQVMGPDSYSVVIATTDFVPGELRQQVQAALLAAPAAPTTQPASENVKACVQKVTGGAHPKLVEKALFGGQPATIIVVNTGTGEQTSVAGPLCSGTRSDLLTPTVVLSGISGP